MSENRWPLALTVVRNAYPRSPTPSRQRGGIAKTLAIVLGVIVIVFWGFYYIGTQSDPQTIAEEMAASIEREFGGEVSADAPFLRHDGAEAHGSMVVMRLIILDNWPEHVVDEIRQEFDGQPNALESFAEWFSAQSAPGMEAGLCQDLLPFSAVEEISRVGARVEYLDERGALLAKIERPTSEYCFQ